MRTRRIGVIVTKLSSSRDFFEVLGKALVQYERAPLKWDGDEVEEVEEKYMAEE